VLVCQIEAAGVGVNIQAASVVILCEPQVKPSIEAQAIARAHRMGQVRTVQVHRLLIADSVDERMIEILSSKAQLFDAYVRHSTIAHAAPGAVDISEVQLARMIVAQEQQRLAGTAEPPSRLVTSTTSAHSDRLE
jgi:ABC-type branched-subunit amino acid transport system ATPase component